MPLLFSAGFQARLTMCTRPAGSGVSPRQGHNRRLLLPLPSNSKEGKGHRAVPSGEAAQRVVLAAGTLLYRTVFRMGGCKVGIVLCAVRGGPTLDGSSRGAEGGY